MSGMSRYYVHLNNGNWRIYSSIVEDYVTDELTFDELVEFRRQEAIQQTDTRTYSLLSPKSFLHRFEENEFKKYLRLE